VLYELLTNAKAVTGENNFALIKGHVSLPPRPFAETDPHGLVPPPVRAAVLKALQKRPEDRFQSAAEFADALRAALGPRGERTVIEETIVTKPGAVAAPPPPVERTVVDEATQVRTRRGYAMAAVIVLLIAIAATAWWLRPKQEVVPTRVAARSDTAPGTTMTVAAPPTAEATGQLLINALPWGYVASVTDAAGVERLTGGPAETPLLVALPPGPYKVRLTNPYSTRAVVLDAVVQSNETAQVQADLDRVDAATYVDGLAK